VCGTQLRVQEAVDEFFGRECAQLKLPGLRGAEAGSSAGTSTMSISSLTMFPWSYMGNKGLRYWRWGGRGLYLGAEKTRSRKNARKCRRILSAVCTLF